MAGETDAVIIACEAEWDRWKGDCSGFVKAVAARLGIKLTGQANDLLELFKHSPDWRNLSHDVAAVRRDIRLGNFVVGGLKARPHGHVVVIVDLPSEKYPVGYWGRFGSVGKKAKTINWSFTRPDLARVEYFARSL